MSQLYRVKSPHRRPNLAGRVGDYAGTVDLGHKAVVLVFTDPDLLHDLGLGPLLREARIDFREDEVEPVDDTPAAAG